jgi:hypothetical protein
LRNGAEYSGLLGQRLQNWLEKHEYESVQQMKRGLNQSCAIYSAALVHSNYMHVI